VALVTVMQNRLAPEDVVSAYTIKEDMNRAGFNDLGVSIALHGILDKGMVTTAIETDWNGNDYFHFVRLADIRHPSLNNDFKINEI